MKESCDLSGEMKPAINWSHCVNVDDSCSVIFELSTSWRGGGLWGEGRRGAEWGHYYTMYTNSILNKSPYCYGNLDYHKLVLLGWPLRQWNISRCLHFYAWTSRCYWVHTPGDLTSHNQEILIRFCSKLRRETAQHCVLKGNKWTVFTTDTFCALTLVIKHTHQTQWWEWYLSTVRAKKTILYEFFWVSFN